MALLAEQIVEEWLNRDRYFTMRGIKHGVNEIDLLGIKRDNEIVKGIHVEVQVSVNPTAYISKLDEALMKELGAKSKNSAKARSETILKSSVEKWVNKKFFSPEKAKVRARTWPDVKWHFAFVHGKVKDPSELVFIKDHNIELIPFNKVINDLRNTSSDTKGNSGSDLLDIIAYYISSD